MKKRISKIENDVQDRNSLAWKKLCDSESNNLDFNPSNLHLV